MKMSERIPKGFVRITGRRHHIKTKSEIEKLHDVIAEKILHFKRHHMSQTKIDYLMACKHALEWVLCKREKLEF